MTTHILRSSSRAPLALLLAAAGCGDGGTPPAGPDGSATPSGIVVLQGTGAGGVAGLPLRDSVAVRLVDAGGRGVAGVVVHFAAAAGSGSFAPSVATTGADGVAKARWTLAEGAAQQQGTASAGALSASLAAQASIESPTVLSMLRALDAQIASAAATIRDLLPRNPQLATHAEAKLAMLGQPTLALDVVHARRWIAGGAMTASGRQVPIIAVFPTEALREEATRSVRSLEWGILRAESFVGAPFPAADIRVWQGFVLGNSGGGGQLFMEDQATYESRTPSTRLPYEAILLHELSHSYVGNEALTQFLELYLYNLRHAATTDPSAWIFTRDWVPDRAGNEGVHALLDVYRLIGHAAMANAYRTLAALRPPYGQPLSAAAREAFVDQAPEPAKAVVAAKVSTITF